MKKNRNTGEADWPDQPGTILILSVTRSGRAFRPGDWIDRLAGLYSIFLLGPITQVFPLCEAGHG